MLEVVVVIAHHPLGREPWLQNVTWALQDIPHRITILTLARYGFQPIHGERYIALPESEHNDRDFYDFYHFYFAGIIDTTDAETILLLQQDIYLVERLKRVPGCLAITEDIHFAYFAVYDAKGDFLYPRIWEGGVFYPTKFLREAHQDGVKFGYDYWWARLAENHDALMRMHFKWVSSNWEVVPVPYWRDNPPGGLIGDCFSDLTLYACSRAVPYIGLPITAHLCGPEYCHERIPSVYDDPKILLKVIDGAYHRPARDVIPSITLAYLIAGVIRPGHLAKLLLKASIPGYRHALRFRAARIELHHREWMTSQQGEAFRWGYTQTIENDPGVLTE